MSLSEENFKSSLSSFEGKKVLVVGDVMVDAYWWGNVNRISPEAPVPVVEVENEERRLGGAANVALNLKHLKAEPLVCAITGNDISGETFNSLLQMEGIDSSLMIRSDEKPTTVKTRILGNKSHLLRVDKEDGNGLSSTLRKQFYERVIEGLDQAGALIFQDYDKGLLNPEIIEDVTRAAHRKGVEVYVDPKKKNFSAYRNVDLFKPNLKELIEGLRLEEPEKPDKAFLQKAAEKLKAKIAPANTLVTLSEHGAWAIDDKGNQHHVPARFRDIVDVSGAGDTVLAVASLARLAGFGLKDTAWLSNLAGGMVCERVGVVPIHFNDLAEEGLKEMANQGRPVKASIEL